MTTSPFSGVISFPRPYKREGAPSCGIYLIAPAKLRVNLFGEQLKTALRALNSSQYEKNMHALELRFPAAIYEKQRQEALALVNLCKRNGVVPIIRSDIGLCVEADADGVILEHPADVEKARHLLGGRAIIGVDCGNSRDKAQAALAAEADYVSFSRFFSSSDRKRAELSLLEWWSSQTELPAVAIGAIDADRAIAMVRSGAGFLGGGSWVWNYRKGPAQAIYLLQECIEHGLSPPQTH